MVYSGLLLFSFCVSSFCILWLRFVSVVAVVLEFVVCFLWFAVVCVLCVYVFGLYRVISMCLLCRLMYIVLLLIYCHVFLFVVCDCASHVLSCV